jgi:hypothetical protein
MWCGTNILTVVPEDTFRPAERSLVQLGEHEPLREMRMFFQYATVRGHCEPVERLTGRTVRAFVSGIDTEANGCRSRRSCPIRTATPAPRAPSCPPSPDRPSRGSARW